MDFVYMLLSSLVLVISLFYSVSNLINKRYNFKDIKVYLFFVLIVIINLVCWYFVSKPLKIIVLTLNFSIYIFYIFKENFIKSILTSIFYQFVIIVSELVFAIITIPFFNTDIEISESVSLFLPNLIISSFAAILCRTKILKQLYNYLIKITKRVKQQEVLVIYLLIIFIADMFGMIIYYKVSYIYLLIFNTLFTLFCFYIVISTFEAKDNYIKVYDKYNTTLNSLKEYENILDRYKISTHENKNELLTIRNMIPKTNKKIICYIDRIVDNKLKDNEKVMFETSKIPAGGLRGLIYSKILLIKESKIEYELQISKEVRTFNLIELDDNLVLDICKIIGVYIDNAIEEVQKIKEKYISIEMYMENDQLIISISNTYEGVIDIEKLEDKGYTSKGKNHGYGLSLVKEIIQNNNKLQNKKTISKEIFCQKLIINL